LGEYKGVPAVGFQTGHQFTQQDALVEAGRRCVELPAATASQSSTAVVRGRAMERRIWSAATRRAMESSQVRAEERPAKPGSARSARR